MFWQVQHIHDQTNQICWNDAIKAQLTPKLVYFGFYFDLTEIFSGEQPVIFWNCVVFIFVFECLHNKLAALNKVVWKVSSRHLLDTLFLNFVEWPRCSATATCLKNESLQWHKSIVIHLWVYAGVCLILIEEGNQCVTVDVYSLCMCHKCLCGLLHLIPNCVWETDRWTS